MKYLRFAQFMYETNLHYLHGHKMNTIYAETFTEATDLQSPVIFRCL